jgi:hypothetical protein
MKSKAVPCPFVYTGYTNNVPEYSVVKILYTNTFALAKPFKQQTTYSYMRREVGYYLQSVV